MGSIERQIKWSTSSLDIILVIDRHDCVRLRSFLPHNSKQADAPGLLRDESDLPLTSVRLAGDGNTFDKTSKSLIGCYASARLKYQKHESQTFDHYDQLIIHTMDETTKLYVSTYMLVYKNIPVLKSFVEVVNKSTSDCITVTQLSSLTIGGVTRSSKNWFKDYTIISALNGWYREVQWREQTLPDVGIDNNGILEFRDDRTASQATFGLSNHGSFSTGSYLPMGALKRTDNLDTLLWQVEHNGSWRWEIGDFKDSVYLAAGGPTAVDHNCKITLHPDETFRSIPVACTRVNGGLEEAFAALTSYRRAIKRPHPDNEDLPIIFNDYMNCLMGDPDENKIKALLGPASRSGAEYFVIDCGWYADDGNWWDAVGLWEPSRKRFPSGFNKLLDTIRETGLIPGLWLEPEVVGVRSVVAKRLPQQAFFHENGVRLVERGRYQLDYRQPEVIEWMTSVVDKLIVEYGIKYFKFDYNIEVIPGTDIDGSPGSAHLDHQRAYLAWVRKLLDAHPGLVIENCASGGQRMDYASLSTHTLQSTSDQQDPLLYAAIAAAAPTAVLPEQSASWAYPQPGWDDEKIAFTVVNSLLGRVHLSGHIDLLSESQFQLITEGMTVYRKIRGGLKDARPFWPLGLPKWHDDWVCLGMATKEHRIWLSVWRRGGGTEATISLPLLKGVPNVDVKLLYPANFEVEYTWNANGVALDIKLPAKPCARLFELKTS